MATWEPDINRLSRSRPYSSVPSQWRVLGPAKTCAVSTASGLYGVQNSETMATITMIATMSPPMTRLGLRRHRCQRVPARSTSATS